MLTKSPSQQYSQNLTKSPKSRGVEISSVAAKLCPPLPTEMVSTLILVEEYEGRKVTCRASSLAWLCWQWWEGGGGSQGG
jgi:hypothetical protein